ncbi:unnamed protein product [Nesidiocoris tenuis]|uniref:SH2 domain-containing protein n=1 Tax=Nesidiocoris tenuis TaxID=355587 RepID=A0A6H5GGS5_9HEMI|nr:unnamed protein product [Nesidiocoris tenuis]
MQIQGHLVFCCCLCGKNFSSFGGGGKAVKPRVGSRPTTRKRRSTRTMHFTRTRWRKTCWTLSSPFTRSRQRTTKSCPSTKMGDYSVSLKAPGRNKHFRVHVDGALYCIGQRKFHTLDQLVDHYQRAPIYTNKQESVCTDGLWDGEGNGLTSDTGLWPVPDRLATEIYLGVHEDEGQFCDEFSAQGSQVEFHLHGVRDDDAETIFLLRIRTEN